METSEFDEALVTSAFAQAAATGWRGLSIVEAARAASLPLDRARTRFPGSGAVLMRLGLMADTAALAEPVNESLVRDRLFDLLMRRFDVLQRHRAGVLALLAALPRDPVLSLALGAATLRSMAWMLEAAGLSASGLRGVLRAKALVAVWLYALRAWQKDDSPDLARTMAALDKALDRAEQISNRLTGVGLDDNATRLPDEPLDEASVISPTARRQDEPPPDGSSLPPDIAPA